MTCEKMTMSFLDDASTSAYDRALLVGTATRSDRIVARLGVVPAAAGRSWRIDIACADETLCFQEARMVGTKACIGYGQRLILVDLVTEEVDIVQLDGYFCGFFGADDLDYSGGDFSVLASSASELLALNVQGKLVWKTDGLAIDGVIVHRASSAGIEGSGEWDPPGGWVPFVLETSSGKRLTMLANEHAKRGR